MCTKLQKSLPTRSLCWFWHYWPWRLDHPSLILVRYPWLCSQMVQILSVISLLPCQMWNRLVFLVHILLRCPPRLCPWSTTLRHVHQTPLSTIISSCSLNHHLYADDTQLFLSFLPTRCASSIDHLHNALDRISWWMTANLLTLNSSKTEFLLFGLSEQLAKINNSSLTTTISGIQVISTTRP